MHTAMFLTAYIAAHILGNHGVQVLLFPDKRIFNTD